MRFAASSHSLGLSESLRPCAWAVDLPRHRLTIAERVGGGGVFDDDLDAASARSAADSVRTSADVVAIDEGRSTG
jgi:hypothetical protein